MMVPCMIAALADLSDAQPALTGRLKAAAMQLLPPLLAGVHARRLGGQPESGWSAERLQQWFSLNSRVSAVYLHLSTWYIWMQELMLWQASAHAHHVCPHGTSLHHDMLACGV